MDRKKELKSLYKVMKPDMGIYCVSSKATNDYFLEGTKDLKGSMNGSLFKLGCGSHPNRGLQKAWKETGEEGFLVEVLEYLKYDNEDLSKNYEEELKLLEMIWIEKFEMENKIFYKR